MFYCLAARLVRVTCFSATLLIVPALLHAQTDAKDSPFLPPSSAVSSQANAREGYVLTGMTVVGKETLLGITNQREKRSVWVPVGKSVGEITAVSYDPQGERAVIRAGGQTYTLTLKKGGVVAGPLLPVRPSAAPVTVSPPQATPAPVEVPGNLSPQEEKEMEARMLVTDLLEIGQQQRKAYAEAQRQAAAKAGGQAPSTPPAASTSASQATTQTQNSATKK